MSQLVVSTWHVLAAFFAGTTVLAVVSRYLLVRFTKVIDAAAREYITEVSKIKAQCDHIDQLVSQTRTLTETVEQVKSRMSKEEWDRQRHWEFQKDTCVRLTEAMGEMWRNLLDRQNMLDGFRTADPMQRQGLQQEAERSVLQFHDSVRRFMAARDTARLTLSEQALMVLNKIIISDPNFDPEASETDTSKAASLILDVLKEFVTAARHDLCI